MTFVHRHDTRRIHAGPMCSDSLLIQTHSSQDSLIRPLAHQFQDLDRGVIIVEQLTLASMPHQTVKHRVDLNVQVINNFPLGGGGHGDSKIPLQDIHSIEGQPGPIL